MNWSYDAVHVDQTIQLGVGATPIFFVINNASFQTDIPVQVSANLVIDGVSQDVGQKAATYDADSGIGIQAQQNFQSQGAGGFTETDRQMLAAIDNWAVIRSFLNQSIEQEVTSGPSQGPVVIQQVRFVFALVVRITTFPTDIVPQTPDGSYWFQDLAVVRVFHGNDVWLRVPIHTETKIVPLIDTNLYVGVATGLIDQWLANVNIVVDFRAGVEGRVFLQHSPV